MYFLTPDNPIPSGGIRVIYRHVDILNSAGIPAFVLHQRRGFRCEWFNHQTRITDISTARIFRDDLLVVPEIYINVLGQLLPGVRYVIFNQNSHLTWTQGVGRLASAYRDSDEFGGVIAVSSHNSEMLQHAFPGCKVRRIHLSIDPVRFHPQGGKKPNRITYMPRRAADDAEQVLQLLGSRGALAGWEVVPLDAISHDRVAIELGKSRIFLSFTYQEGFGLPAAEAMACGNYVIGYHGFAGREFFQPAFSAPVETGDILAFVRGIEDALSGERADPDWCRKRGTEASRFILAEYAPQRERDDVVRAYTEILATSRYLGVRSCAS